jgi:hypothetical protein
MHCCALGCAHDHHHHHHHQQQQQKLTGWLPGTPQVMKILTGRNGCIKPDGTRRLFLDVGANFGWYSVYAARLGCRWVTG